MTRSGGRSGPRNKTPGHQLLTASRATSRLRMQMLEQMQQQPVVQPVTHLAIGLRPPAFLRCRHATLDAKALALDVHRMSRGHDFERVAEATKSPLRRRTTSVACRKQG